MMHNDVATITVAHKVKVMARSWLAVLLLFVSGIHYTNIGKSKIPRATSELRVTSGKTDFSNPANLSKIWLIIALSRIA